MKAIFLRMLDADDKGAALLAAVSNPESTWGTLRFEVEVGNFKAIPKSPFAYWASHRALQLFAQLDAFESAERAARHGAATLNNTRFLRLAWETQCVSASDWRPYAKGGAYSPFYDDIHLLIRWSANGEELKQYVSAVRERNGWGPHWTAVLNGYEYYLRPGLTWPSRTQSGFAPRVLPAGCIFDCKGNAAFFGGDQPETILGFLAVFLSKTFRSLVEMQMAFGAYDVGVVQRTPVPNVEFGRTLVEATLRAFSQKRSIDSCNETSHAFTIPSLIQVEGISLLARAQCWSEYVRSADCGLLALLAEINEECFDLYGINEDDRRSITKGFDLTTTTASVVAEHDEEQEEDEPVHSHDGGSLAAELVSWFVGVAIGRFDVRLATGARPLPPEPEPFDPLPACSPGMLTGDAGLPLASAPPDYPIAFPENGILVDDPGHPRDLTAAVRAVFDLVFSGRADEWWRDVGAVLDLKGADIRAWLAGDFFEFHIKRYSKSRRKAPIYWRLGTPSGRYSVWLYVHRATGDTLFRVLNDFAIPKISHEEQSYARLLTEAGGSPTSSQRKAIEEQEDLVGELKAFADELRVVAPLWKPDLDDGVIINFAPLWRLVPHHKAWQKECKACWDSLCGGEYDWAHLAMHLWPQRVVPKCAEDASLAIAHGLDDLFWVKEAGRWRRLGTPDDEIKRQKERRVSPARDRIRASLEKLCTGDAGKRSCATVWEALSSGAMDDAPLALALWPQRVIEGCRASIALAGAHGFKESDLKTQRAADNLLRRYEDPDLDELRPAIEVLLRDRTDTAAATWQALQRGDLDQQRVALAVWPDRVIDKCLKDRSLAEHHGLRMYFWYEAPDHGWRRRQPPKEEIAWETTRRHNPSVQSALAKLLAAPVPGTGKRGDRRTRPPASSTGTSADAAKPKRRGKKAKGDASAEEGLF